MSHETDALLTPPGSGVAFGTLTETERRAEVEGLADILRQALPPPRTLAANLATSTAGNLIALSALPLPVKLAVIAVPLAVVGWRWLRRKRD